LFLRFLFVHFSKTFFINPLRIWYVRLVVKNWRLFGWDVGGGWEHRMYNLTPQDFVDEFCDGVSKDDACVDFLFRF